MRHRHSSVRRIRPMRRASPVTKHDKYARGSIERQSGREAYAAPASFGRSFHRRRRLRRCHPPPTPPSFGSLMSSDPTQPPPSAQRGQKVRSASRTVQVQVQVEVGCVPSVLCRLWHRFRPGAACFWPLHRHCHCRRCCRCALPLRAASGHPPSAPPLWPSTDRRCAPTSNTPAQRTATATQNVPHHHTTPHHTTPHHTMI
jgi:hypothetical protein